MLFAERLHLTMLGKTHRVGGALSALIGFAVLQSQDALIPDVNPWLQLAVIYPFAIYGSVVSDLDHNWDSAPAKDPISKFINAVLHLTTGIRQKKKSKGMSVLGIFDAKHRSWQTHSDALLLLIIFAGWWLIQTPVDGINSVLFKLIALGLILGVFSHLFLDSLTPEGIWTLIPSVIRRKRVSFHLVPKKQFFATGGPWERLIRTLMWVAIILLFIYVLYMASPYRFHFNFGVN